MKNQTSTERTQNKEKKMTDKEFREIMIEIIEVLGGGGKKKEERYILCSPLYGPILHWRKGMAAGGAIFSLHKEFETEEEAKEEFEKMKKDFEFRKAMHNYLHERNSK